MLSEIKNTFLKAADSSIAEQQAAYMKNKFEFFGLPSPIRKGLQRPFLLRNRLPEKEEAFRIAKDLWNEPQREFHYFAMELVFKYKKEFTREDIVFFEWLITKNSWWDSIDYIAPKIVGAYFLKLPKERSKTVNKWIESDNIWLQRSAILFQLKYKDQLDKQLLTYIIEKLKGEKEFFIRKAIGWILREHSKLDPKWVKSFVNSIELQPLSQKEALKVIERKGI